MAEQRIDVWVVGPDHELRFDHSYFVGTPEPEDDLAVALRVLRDHDMYEEAAALERRALKASPLGIISE